MVVILWLDWLGMDVPHPLTGATMTWHDVGYHWGLWIAGLGMYLVWRQAWQWQRATREWLAGPPLDEE